MDPTEARARLEEERHRLLQVRAAAAGLSGAALLAAQRELSEIDQHPAEQASETLERELDNTVVQRVDDELAEVQAALRRIEAGTYGLCEACGKPIAEGRLEAMPAARYCVEDQARADRGLL
jgi:RNA polymerase-binding transcription factor DksA